MKSPAKKILFFLSVLSLSTLATEPSAEKRGWLFNASDSLTGKILDDSEDFQIGTTIAIDIPITEGVNASLAYTYQIEPSYSGGYYSRIDRWKLKEDIRPGDIIQSLAKSQLPVFLNITHGNEIVFIRHYKDRFVAATVLPYTPIHLPLTATLARENLRPGDFVTIPTEMNVLIGAGLNVPLPTPAYITVKARGELSYLISGHFQLQIMKMADEKVKLKLIALRKKETKEMIGLDWNLSVFELPGIKDLNLAYPASFKTGTPLIDENLQNILIDSPKRGINNGINSMFEETLINLSLIQSDGKLWEIDYIFDLKNGEAAEAYNNILNSTLSFKTLSSFNHFLTDEFGVKKDDHKIIVTDLDSVEEIIQEDKNKIPSLRRIERLFKGQNDFNTSAHSWKIGAILYRSSGRTTAHEDLISYFNLENEKNNVLYLSNSKNKSHGFIFDLLKEEQYWNNFVLFNVNDQKEFNNNGLSDLGFNYSMSDRMMTIREQMQFQKALKKNLPESIYKSIPWDKMLTQYSPQKNINVNFQILFDKQIINILTALSYEQIVKSLQQYNQESKLFTQKEIIDVASLIKECLKKMENEQEESKTKIKNIIKLQRQNIFTKYGPRLIFSLLDKNQINNYVYFRINWGSKSVAPIEYLFGTNPLSELFPIFQRMQFLIDQGQFNLNYIEFDPTLMSQKNR